MQKCYLKEGNKFLTWNSAHVRNPNKNNNVFTFRVDIPNSQSFQNIFEYFYVGQGGLWLKLSSIHSQITALVLKLSRAKNFQTQTAIGLKYTHV